MIERRKYDWDKIRTKEEVINLYRRVGCLKGTAKSLGVPVHVLEKQMDIWGIRERRRSLDWDKICTREELEVLYQRTGHLSRTAKKLGVKTSELRGKMYEWGIGCTGSKIDWDEVMTDEELLSMYRSMGLNRISEVTGLDPVTIRRRLIELGVTLKPHGPPPYIHREVPRISLMVLKKIYDEQPKFTKEYKKIFKNNHTRFTRIKNGVIKKYDLIECVE
jgi:hypothetical protein